MFMLENSMAGKIKNAEKNYIYVGELDNSMSGSISIQSGLNNIISKSETEINNEETFSDLFNFFIAVFFPICCMVLKKFDWV